MATRTAELDAADMREASDPVWRIVTGAGAFAAGVFICGSVGSYDVADPSWNAATDQTVNNLFGAGGAVFADLARQLLGWSSWIAGFALMLGGAMRAVLIGTPRIYRWMLGCWLCLSRQLVLQLGLFRPVGLYALALEVWSGMVCMI